MNGTTIYNYGGNNKSGGIENLLKSINLPVKEKSGSYYDELLALVKAEMNISTETETGQKIPADMTLDEYKIYLTQKINAIPFHESRSKDVELVHISDAAWEALKNDPNYEAKILADIAKDRANYNSILDVLSPGGNCKVRYIESTPERCYTVGTEDGKVEEFSMEVSALGDFWASSSTRKRRLETVQKVWENYLKSKITTHNLSFVKVS